MTNALGDFGLFWVIAAVSLVVGAYRMVRRKFQRTQKGPRHIRRIG